MVEIDGSALDYKLPEVITMAEGVWARTKQPTAPRQQIGFGGQIVERRSDRHPAGEPIWHYDSEPATAAAIFHSMCTIDNHDGCLTGDMPVMP